MSDSPAPCDVAPEASPEYCNDIDMLPPEKWQNGWRNPGEMY
jgi:hypothetical protein